MAAIYAPYQGTYLNEEFVGYERAKKFIKEWNVWEKCFPTHVLLWLVNEKIKMSDLLTCEFNIDTACVELCFADGSMISIDCTAVENEVADNMYQRSELDYLIYNDPVAYANLILNGDPETYLKTVTEYNPLD